MTKKLPFEPKVYRSKEKKLSGSSFQEIRQGAELIYKNIKTKTKRTPYVRSMYFKKEKIFLTLFWAHLFEKQEKDRVRRLRFFACTIDLIKNSNYDPETRENFSKKDELLHRFSGISKDGDNFIVQVKENKRTKRKDLISIYPK